MFVETIVQRARVVRAAVRVRVHGLVLIEVTEIKYSSENYVKGKICRIVAGLTTCDGATALNSVPFTSVRESCDWRKV